jgi:hypothetical protein
MIPVTFEEDSLMKHIFVFDVDEILPLSSGNLSAIFTRLQIWFRKSIGWEGCTIKKSTTTNTRSNRKKESNDRLDYYYYYIRGAGKGETSAEKEEERKKWNCTRFHDIACKTIRPSAKFDTKIQAWILRLCSGDSQNKDFINRLLNVINIKLKLLRKKENKKIHTDAYTHIRVNKFK